MSIMELNSAWPSKAESAKTAREFAHKARQKEGGLWNFMTWSFFISQALGGEQFIGAAAAATAEGDPQGRKGNVSDDVTKNPGLGQPNGSGRSDAGEEARGIAGQGHAESTSGPADAPDSLSKYADLPEADAVGRASAEQSGTGAVQLAADDALNGPGGDSTPVDNPSLAGAGGHGPLPDIDLGSAFDPGGLLPGIGDGVSDIVDSVVDNAVLPLTDHVQALTGTIDDLVGSIDDLLDNAVAPLTDALDTIVEGTVSPLLANVNDLIESLGDGLGLTGGLGGRGEDNGGPLLDAVASSGQIVFKALPVGGDPGLDSLFSGGGYTDYNLALRSGAADSAPSHGVANASGSSTLLDHILTGSNDTGHQLDDDQARNVGLPSVLDEIALRGLGDGITA